MKKVALHGSYYGDNFGDTLFVIHFLDWLKENDLGSEKAEIFLPFASERVRNLVEVSEKKGIKSIIEANSLVFFGGGYLGEPPSNITIWSYRLIIRHLSIAFLAYLLKKPYIFIGVGAGPLSNKIARRLTVFLCNKSQKTIVRDQESKNYLLEYGVKEEKLKVTADSILTMEPKDVDMNEKVKLLAKYNLSSQDSRLIGVHLPVGEKDINKLKLIINDLRKYCMGIPNYKLVIFNDFYKEDYNYLAESIIYDVFDNDKVISIKYETPNELITLINELDIVITTKLHCGIVANCLGKHTISVSVHSKTIRLYKQLGLSERNVALKDYETGILQDMLLTYQHDINNTSNIPNPIRELAYENRDELINFVNKY
ncbi:polysaccharide pyruvyl transferase family protein [Metabacillus indicus]|uniref:polysaccharide pyruvyl transferase family protein n=1 Tax=Metabacillus indicus TaxID=246786 RepID=UPI002A039FB4|nr:polysaccharide pyruvyl transferase family protein [Metabacillus indicus]MDX8289015.1 polysaccharide pyruvyl transferase family protein [Metabacillus indicus]